MLQTKTVKKKINKKKTNKSDNAVWEYPTVQGPENSSKNMDKSLQHTIKSKEWEMSSKKVASQLCY